MFLDLIKEKRAHWKYRLSVCGYTIKRFCTEFEIGRTRMSQYLSCDDELASATIRNIAKIEDSIKTVEERYRENQE